VMKGNKVNTLYHLLAETITGTAAISLDEFDSNLTQLWHMCLGHMSEVGMTMLSDKELLKGQKHENLTYVSTAFFGSSVELSLLRLFI